MDQWSCPVCTYENVSGEACEVCETPKLGVTETENALAKGANSCPVCTFDNDWDADDCGLCGAHMKTSVDALHVAGNKPDASSSGLSACKIDDSSGSGIPPVVPFAEANEQEGTRHDKPSAKSNNVKRVADPSEEEDRGRKKGKVEMECGSEGGEADPPPTSMNSLLASLHAERMARKGQTASTSNPANSGAEGDDAARSAIMAFASNVIRGSISNQSNAAAATASGSGSTAANVKEPTITILTYNVWFNENLEVEQRMAAIGRIVEEHSPHVVCFQEVTPNIYSLFAKSKWWTRYKCSKSAREVLRERYFSMQCSRLPVAQFGCHPFGNSCMGRDLNTASVKLGDGLPLLVATSHLESPCPQPPTWDQMYSEERVAQAKEAIERLRNAKNVVFAGDMNWTDNVDGAPPLPAGWKDAWAELRPFELGHTYDTQANGMLSGGRGLKKRLDRMFCHLSDFDFESIEMVGTQPIPGLTYRKESRTSSKSLKPPPPPKILPVFPSDHFGLLLTLRRRT